MRLIAVAAQGFRAFTKDTVFKFPSGPGFYFLGGENRLHPELGPNAVGKSSLWDAIIWCFTGKSSRKLKAGNVANWAREHLCSVTVDWEQGGKLYNLTRTWSPNSLSLQVGKGNPEPITEEELQKLTRFDHATFLHTVLMSQFGEFFFDKSATEKLHLFSELFDLKYWLDRSTAAAKASREAREDRIDHEKSIEKIDGALETIADEMAAAKTASEKWEKARSRRRKKLRNETKEVSKKEEDAAEHLKHCERKLKQAKKKERSAAWVTAGYEKKLTQLRRITVEAVTDLKSVQRGLDACLKEITRLETMGEGDCPTCYQPITKEHINDVGLTLRSETLADHERAVHKARDAHERAADEQARTQALHDDAAELQVRMDRKRVAALSRFDAATAALAAVSKERERAAEMLADFDAEVNPHTAAATRLKQRRKKLKSSRKEAKQERERAAKDEDRYGFWSKKFKELRLWLIERALTEFEVTVNNSLIDLGLNGWEITFDVERENTSGGVTKGFSVFIKSPESEEPCPWESWSGGETQRLRIAGALGLADLISSRRGFYPQIEVWDEPTQHLSTEGITDLLRFFKTRARDLNKQVWLIDHKTLAAGDFDGSATIMRDKHGVHVIQ